LVCLVHQPADSQLYPLSLHDALPLSRVGWASRPSSPASPQPWAPPRSGSPPSSSPSSRTPCERPSPSSPLTPSSTLSPRDSLGRSEEHTSELQSREKLVCRLLLEIQR